MMHKHQEMYFEGQSLGYYNAQTIPTALVIKRLDWTQGIKRTLNNENGEIQKRARVTAKILEIMIQLMTKKIQMTKRKLHYKEWQMLLLPRQKCRRK